MGSAGMMGVTGAGMGVATVAESTGSTGMRSWAAGKGMMIDAGVTGVAGTTCPTAAGTAAAIAEE